MKSYRLYSSLLVFIAVSTVASISHAGKNNDTQANGKPFQEIHQKIAENRQLIDSNQSAIDDLLSTADALQSAISTVVADVEALEFNVEANQVSVTQLWDAVNANSGDLAQIATDLVALEAKHDADSASLQAALTGINTSIASLQVDLANLGVSLNNQLAQLRSDVGNNALAIDGLLLELSATSAKAMANMIQISQLQFRVDSLESRAAQHEAELADLTAALAELKVTVCGEAGACTSCGDGVLDAGEEFDPAPGPYSTAPVDPQSCKFDFTNVRQLYCNGSCTWGGGSSCDQVDADILCKLKTGNPDSTAASWTRTTALSEHGFSCPFLGSQLPQEVQDNRGVTLNFRARYQNTSILANHGPGVVVADPVCTD